MKGNEAVAQICVFDCSSSCIFSLFSKNSISIVSFFCSIPYMYFFQSFKIFLSLISLFILLKKSAICHLNCDYYTPMNIIYKLIHVTGSIHIHERVLIPWISVHVVKWTNSHCTRETIIKNTFFYVIALCSGKGCGALVFYKIFRQKINESPDECQWI